MKNSQKIKLCWAVLICCFRAFRPMVLMGYYDYFRWKYSKIMISQFCNGYSNSPEYYKFKRYKEKSEYYEKKFLDKSGIRNIKVKEL